MTHEEKVLKVMKGSDLLYEEAEATVYMLDWIGRETDFLEEIYPQFKIDIDWDASFMAMCVALWEDESTGIKQANSYQN
jgi:hypothetical protein